MKKSSEKLILLINQDIHEVLDYLHEELGKENDLFNILIDEYILKPDSFSMSEYKGKLKGFIKNHYKKVITYNKPNIRSLLQNVLYNEGFDILCQDYFPDVSKNINNNMTLNQKIIQLFEYCDKHSAFDKLIDILKSMNLPRYNEYEPYSNHNS